MFPLIRSSIDFPGALQSLSRCFLTDLSRSVQVLCDLPKHFEGKMLKPGKTRGTCALHHKKLLKIHVFCKKQAYWSFLGKKWKQLINMDILVRQTKLIISRVVYLLHLSSLVEMGDFVSSMRLSYRAFRWRPKVLPRKDLMKISKNVWSTACRVIEILLKINFRSFLMENCEETGTI